MEAKEALTVARQQRFWEIVLFVCVSCSIAVHATTCNVTQPNGNTPPGEQPDNKFYGNGSLWTLLWWPGGTLTYPPGGPGIILADGSLQVKVGWIRGVKGKLTIQGRRIGCPRVAPTRVDSRRIRRHWFSSDRRNLPDFRLLGRSRAEYKKRA